MTEHDLLVDCLQRLNRLDVGYLLTGSMASNYWGIPRTTHDLDFVVQFPPSDVPRVVAAFEGDYFIQESSVRSAFRPPHQFNAIDNRSALKVDFWLLRDDAFSRTMFARRVQVTVLATRAWLATAEDVLLHKLYWHTLSPSDRQLGDAAGVWAVQGTNLDIAHLRRWAAELRVAELLEDILAGRVRPKAT
jgi:hypothetical protein